MPNRENAREAECLIEPPEKRVKLIVLEALVADPVYITRKIETLEAPDGLLREAASSLLVLFLTLQEVRSLIQE